MARLPCHCLLVFIAWEFGPAVMADSSLSSDLEQDSPPRPPKQRKVSGNRSASSSRKALPSKAAVGQDKDALRHHKALECQCDKARQATIKSLGLAPQATPSPQQSQGHQRRGVPVRHPEGEPRLGGFRPFTSAFKMAILIYAGHFERGATFDLSPPTPTSRGHFHSNCSEAPRSGRCTTGQHPGLGLDPRS